MTTFTIESTFQALKIQSYLNREGVKYKSTFKSNRKLPTLGEIFKATCNYHQKHHDEVMTKRRKREYVYVRYEFFHIAKKYHPKTSLKTLGNFVGGRDHSTVIHGLTFIDDAINGPFKATLENRIISNNIKNIIALLS